MDVAWLVPANSDGYTQNSVPSPVRNCLVGLSIASVRIECHDARPGKADEPMSSGACASHIHWTEHVGPRTTPGRTEGDPMGQASDVVNRFYEVTNARRAQDLAPLVRDDVTLVGPLMQAAGAAEYLAMNEQLLGFHAGTRMLRQFEDGDDVCSIYELDMKTPSGGSLTLAMADWIRVEDGRIVSQRIYFDPRGFAQAFSM